MGFNRLVFGWFCIFGVVAGNFSIRINFNGIGDFLYSFDLFTFSDLGLFLGWSFTCRLVVVELKLLLCLFIYGLFLAQILKFGLHFKFELELLVLIRQKLVLLAKINQWFLGFYDFNVDLIAESSKFFLIALLGLADCIQQIFFGLIHNFKELFLMFVIDLSKITFERFDSLLLTLVHARCILELLLRLLKEWDALS